MLALSAFTGHFRSIVIFTTIIIVHELGHFLTAYLLKWKVKRIDIYPYGGCSKFDNDINIPLWQEGLVLIMGPLTQILFIYGIEYVIDYNNLELFKQYSNWILIFNLLPIFPLDGGKGIHLILCYWLSYYQALKVTMYIGYFFFITLSFIIIFFHFQVILLLILIVLGITVRKEMKKGPFYYHRFLLERYIKNYHFSKNKKINKIEELKRDTQHTINGLPEKEYLTTIFEKEYNVFIDKIEEK